MGLGAPALAEVELTFRYNVENVDEVRAGLDAFEAQNPDIEVTLERITFKDARDQFIREAAVGVGPDVVHLAFVWVKDLGAAEACLRLNDLIAAKGIGAAGWDDFVANDLMYGPDGEGIHGVPFTTDTFAMIYRTDVMAETGIEAPPQTWEELLEDARAVKERTGKIGFGFAAGASSANTIWFLANYYWWSNGAALVVEDGRGGVATASITLEGRNARPVVSGGRVFPGAGPERFLVASDDADGDELLCGWWGNCECTGSHQSFNLMCRLPSGLDRCFMRFSCSDPFGASDETRFELVR
jgi:multiple sugar transport system substrate-binding protein